MSKPRICKTCKWLHNRVEPCCSCSRWGKGKTDHYIPAEETLKEYLERKEREDMKKEKSIENLSTDELIECYKLCMNGDCEECLGRLGDDCASRLSEAIIKRLKQLQKDIIVIKEMAGDAMYKAMLAFRANKSSSDCPSSAADKDVEVNKRSVEGDALYNGNICATNESVEMAVQRMETAMANGITYAEQLQRERENTSSAPAGHLPLEGKANERDDTARRCGEYVAEKHLQMDDTEWHIIPGDYWRNICGINARQEKKGAEKYGQRLEENTTLSTVQRIEHTQEELIDALKYLEHLKTVAGDKLTANDYQRMAMRTAGEYDTDYDQLRNAAYGLNGEAGEVIDLLKKHEFQGHDLPDEKLIDECGDVLWYCALLADALGFTLEQVMNRNIDKLRKRYPDGFDKNRSINREG